MTTTAESQPMAKKPVKRHLKNYLLDARFQLKYTGMVVAVTMVVALFLGYWAYDYSRGQTESLTINMAMQPDLAPEVAADLEGWAAERDRQVLLAILGGILVLGLALGVTGIMVTHKVVGPAYKMRLLLNDVAKGKLKLAGRLRKGDELQELFEAFANMVESLRDLQESEIAELDAAIKEAETAELDDEVIAHFRLVRDRMHDHLG